MSKFDVIEVAPADLARDPVLPPRIIGGEPLDELCRSLAEYGIVEPLLVRPAPAGTVAGSKYLIVLGSRRQLAASRLTWASVPVMVRDDLDDPAVLQLAFEAVETTEGLTYLEKAWYGAAMKAAGMTQQAIRARTGWSVGKVSSYVRVGDVLTAERIAEAGLVPADLAPVGITKLEAITKGPEDELNARIAAAVGPPATDGQRAPAFEWKKGRGGIRHATFRGTDVANWTPDERGAFVETIGPILAQARRVEGLEDPATAEVRAQLEEAHRLALIKVREERVEQVLRLTDMNEKLVRTLAAKHADEALVGRTQEANPLPLVQRLGASLHRAIDWLRGGSTIERGVSIVEGSPRKKEAQIRIQFDGEEAA